MVVTKPNDENSTVAEISLTSGSEKKRRISDSSPESLVSSATKGVLLTGLAFAGNFFSPTLCITLCHTQGSFLKINSLNLFFIFCIAQIYSIKKRT